MNTSYHFTPYQSAAERAEAAAAVAAARAKDAERLVSADWMAHLLTGRIRTVNIGSTKLECVGEGDDRRFVMSRPGKSAHSLLCVATDADRLDAHLRGYIA